MVEVTLNIPHSLFYDLYHNQHALFYAKKHHGVKMDMSLKARSFHIIEMLHSDKYFVKLLGSWAVFFFFFNGFWVQEF